MTKRALFLTLIVSAGCSDATLGTSSTNQAQAVPLGEDGVSGASGASGATGSSGASGATDASGGHAIKYIFVIALENQDSSTVYGSSHAPYLNSLMTSYAYATHYGDVYKSPNLPSEPHYIQMEAGTNAFSDHTFTTDNDPSASNSTASTDHLVAQLANVPGASWMSYQEDLPAPCPVTSSFPYATKHDPFVFFRDVSFTNGKPDSANAYCAAHHKDFASSFAADLSAKTVATYNFITPNLCNDMHGDARCSNGCTSTSVGYGPCIAAGDEWLKTNLPPIIDFANANQGVVFLVWDEAENTSEAPFLAIGPHLKATGANGGTYNHASLVKSIEEIVGVPALSTVAGVSDFGDFFESGFFP